MSDLMKTARKAVILGHISRLEKLLEEGEKISREFPKGIRDHIESVTEDEEIFGEHSWSVLAIAVAQMSLASREEFRKILVDLTFWMNEDDLGVLDEYIIKKEDEELLNCLVLLSQKLRTRSRKQLQSFLSELDSGGKAYLLLSTSKRSVDLVFRHRISPEVQTYFFDQDD